ncbi:cytochrome P450 [Penicillium cf. griseofulvum]|uniref:Cytochrome P450 n=1 Tax=Penicillium cf. griseofulvum TaxID=2972120 RepID=A0A9W9M3Y7_9EURO|nr:cytochrome P450 [Penicillium cf. griseofulvum]KAJ5434049.1 cytochrome P450 [Penicillium cf. griseofulvum]
MFILDPYPVAPVLCVVCSHDIAEQVTKASKAFPYSIPKPTTRAFGDLFGPRSIITAEGEEWKSLRKSFNPGFASRHLVRLLPCIVDKTRRFVDILEHYATTGEEFKMHELCANLTFDIIGTVTMDIDLCAQLGRCDQNEIIRLFRDLGSTYRDRGGNRGIWINPWTTRYRQRLVRRLDVLIKNTIQRTYAEKTEQYGAGCKPDSQSRSILSLSLQEIDELTPDILDQICDQLKTFLFAGHETTSVLLQWALYELSCTPRAMNIVRRELDEIFRPNSSPENVHEMLVSEQGGRLLSRMSYISAVIKEILRLYPPSGTARYCEPGSGFTIQLPSGDDLCLDGVVLYNCEAIIQRDERVFGETRNTSMPERWLGNTDTRIQSNEDPSLESGSKGSDGQIPPSAWRLFERGPRNCIGQELANIEARVILASMVRQYDFVKVGLGEIKLNESGEPVVNPTGQYEVKSTLYNNM